MPENKAETQEEKDKVRRATDLFPVEVGLVDRGANKLPILVFKNQEGPVTTSALKGASLAALMVTAYDSLDADAQAAAKAKILEGLGIDDAGFDALLGGTMAPPEGAASVVSEALGLAEDDVNAAISADASASDDSDDAGSTTDTDMADGSGDAAGTGDTGTSTPPPASPPAPSDTSTPPPADPAPAPAEGGTEATQMADDPTYVFDSGQKKKCLMTIDELIVRLTGIRAKVQALPDGMDGFYELPLSVAPDVAGASHLAYALDSFQNWNFCLLYKAADAQPVGPKKDKDGKQVESVHKSDKHKPQPPQTIDLKQALTQAVSRGSGPMAAIVRKAIKDELAAHLADFRAGLQQDASTKPKTPQIAPSTSLASEQGGSVETSLKNAQDVQTRAKQLREERLKSKKPR